MFPTSGTEGYRSMEHGRHGEGWRGRDKHINETSAPKVSWKRDMVGRWREGWRDGREGGRDRGKEENESGKGREEDVIGR